MRVLLVYVNTESFVMPVLPLGLASVTAAARKAGHAVSLLNLTREMDIPSLLRDVIRNMRPGIIGVSVRNVDDQSMEDTRFLLPPVKGVIDRCREIASIPIVLGGAGFSIFPESALAYLGADMGIVGEGEAAFVQLLDRLEKGDSLGGVPGLLVKGKGLQAPRSYEKDLDRFPLPRPEAIAGISDPPPGQPVWVPVQTRRGCPMDCAYCSTAAIEGRTLRSRSPEKVVRMISRYAADGFDHFHFVDNTFNLPAAYAEALCDALIRSGLRINWRCILYPHRLDASLVAKMAKAGCREIALGSESGSPQVLHAMNKRFSPEEVRKISRDLGEQGIWQMGFLLFGGPRETRETVRESLDFADSLDLAAMKVTVGIRIYPGTPLARIAVAEGRVAPGDDLLFPRFYLREELAEWLPETLADWVRDRPHWML